jgi:hypothetical protein
MRLPVVDGAKRKGPSLLLDPRKTCVARSPACGNAIVELARGVLGLRATSVHLPPVAWCASKCPDSGAAKRRRRGLSCGFHNQRLPMLRGRAGLRQFAGVDLVVKIGMMFGAMRRGFFSFWIRV